MSRTTGSDATRPRADILVPSSDSRLNHSNHEPSEGLSLPSSGKKLKQDASAMEELLRPSITVKPHPPNIAAKPCSLQPLMLLPREHLPLASLDLSYPHASLDPCRFFESRIKILDLEGRLGTRPKLLIARLESTKAAYVLERQEKGLYTVCKLGAWVDLEALATYATVSLRHLIRPRSRPSTSAGEPPAITTPQLHKDNKKRRLAIEAIQSLVRKPPSRQNSTLEATQVEVAPEATADDKPAESQATTDPRTNASELPAPSESRNGAQSAPVAPSEEQEPPVQPSADDILDNIRNQYFEALYHSKGSLAYFAKGPLSRARAAFHLDFDANLEMSDLVDFLKSLILTTPQIDKKYRETIPEIIAQMKTHIHDSDSDSKVRKRKAKKMKIGKDGLYPTENEHAQKWWNMNKPQRNDDDDFTAAVTDESKFHVSRLRSRETQLQMILILEILALEPLAVAGSNADSQLPGQLPDEDATDIAKDPPAKKRNRHNLPVLLDVHADRLSIWQSTALDEVAALEDSQANEKETENGLSPTSDTLKDFCVDIIMPFFSARLPEQSNAINRKLGGPVLISPPKARSKKPDTAAKSKSKTNGVTKKTAPSKPQRTLERVLSKEHERHRRSISRGPGSMIALMRSASTTTIPMVKREASEPLSLNSIPNDESSSKETKRDLFNTGSSRRRSGEDKAKKDALVQAELQDAISALRKPNRDVVGKAMAEAAERRTTSLSQLKKSRKPTQHYSFQNVVKATPMGARFRDALARDTHSQPAALSSMRSIETDNAPSSSSLIPSSAPRKRKRDLPQIDESPALPSVFMGSLDSISATPAKVSGLQPSLLSGSGISQGLILASSPVARRTLHRDSGKFLMVPSSTLRPQDSGICMPSSPGGGGLAETPIKPRLGAVSKSLDAFATVTPIAKRSIDIENTEPQALRLINNSPDVGIEKPKSIFERLGWDDYDDL